MRQRRYRPARGLLLALGLAAGAVGAQTTGDVETDAAFGEEPEVRRYAVEIILFRYAESVSAGNEVFVPDPPPAAPPGLSPYADTTYGPGEGAPVFDDGSAGLTVPGFGDLPSATSPGSGDDALPDDQYVDGELPPLEEIVLPAARVRLEVMPREALTLDDVHARLELLDAYEPVLWTGWTQDAVDPELAPAIPLRRLGNAPPQFDGTLTLYLSRFLHLVVDLTLTSRPESPYPRFGEQFRDPYAEPYGGAQPAGPGSAASPVPTYGDGRNEFGGGYRFDVAGALRLRIEEDRIVKNGDLRYFDHPRFGLLAKVTRVEDSDAAVDDDIADGGDDTDVLLPPER